MSDSQQTQQKISREDALKYVHQDRRYVGSRETAAYIMYDASQSLNINKYEERFRWDVIKIDFNFIAIQTSIAGVWDVINDTIIATIVEKTRTRWGKFRPYMLFLQIPLTILGLWKWLLPAIFPNTAADYIPKWIVYFAMSVITETADTFKGIAATGLMGTITPHPVERSRLIASAQLVSSLFENAPVLIFGLLYDLTINNKTHWNLYHLFAGFGIPLALLSAGFAMFFFIVSRERVAQSIEKPSVLMGLKAIVNNKPMLIIVLSEFLGKFSIGTGMSNYYIDVLGASSYQTLVGIPASPVSYTSYSFVTPLRRRFSTKSIWLFSDLWVDFWWLVVFAVGAINKNYQKKFIMLPLLAVQEVFRMLVYGPSHVITEELRNEAMDYCEWKNGYRAEAMTGVAKELVNKLMNTAQSAINNVVMKKIGYIQGNIGNQADRTKWWIFALATGIPTITGLIGNVPKFFYPLNQKKRDQMYAELMLRRKAMANRVSNADADELAEIGSAERSGAYLQSLDEMEQDD